MAVVEHVVGPQREGVGVKAGEFLSAHAVGDFIRKARGFWSVKSPVLRMYTKSHPSMLL